MFYRKRVVDAPPVIYSSILVQASSLDDDGNPYSLAQDVVDFVNHATSEALFLREELSQDALRAFHVDFYIAQVTNGGHGQFAHNSRWDALPLRDIDEGLAAIGLTEAIEIFRSFRAYAVREPARFRRTAEGAGFGDIDPFVANLDGRFLRHVCGPLHAALRNWIKGLPDLRPLDDAGYREAILGLAARNGAYAARKLASEAALEHRRARDPVYQTVRFVCHVSSPSARYMQLLSANRTTAAGPSEIILRIVTDQGLATVYLLEDRAALLVEGESAPRSKIPLSMIDAYLARQGLPSTGSIKQGRL